MGRCLICGNESSAETLRCDCGYSYLTGEIAPTRAQMGEPATPDGPLPGEPPPLPGDPPRPAVDYRLAFHGTAKEFFGIWIVNMLLKIVTSGFYTAWANVRQRRYFAGAMLPRSRRSRPRCPRC